MQRTIDTHGLRYLTFGTGLMFFAELANAASVWRCEAPDGNITFTSLSCPAGQQRQQVNAHNPSPGTFNNAIGTVMRITKPASDKPVVIVGSADDGCGNRVVGPARRHAIINQQAKPGMTLRDVESAFGEPDKVIEKNGEKQYKFVQKNRTISISFDQNGCVKGR